MALLQAPPTTRQETSTAMPWAISGMGAVQESISARSAIRRKRMVTFAAGLGSIWPAELVTDTLAPQLAMSPARLARLSLTAAERAGRTVGSARSSGGPGISSVLTWENSPKSRLTWVKPSWGAAPTGLSIFSSWGLGPVETVTLSALLARATAVLPEIR